MKKPDLSPLAPPGVNGAKEVRWTLIGVGLSAAAGLLGFLYQLSDQCNFVKRIIEGGSLSEEIGTFRGILGGNLFCFALVNLAMAGVLLYHIDLHYRGSRSIYLMRRLPQRWELLRRCAALPLLGLLCSVLVWGLLQLLLFWMYLTIPPQDFLPPLYEGGFWAALSRGGFLC